MVVRGARLGGLYNEQTAVQQAVKIYEGTSYLAYWHYIASADYRLRSRLRQGQRRSHDQYICDATTRTAGSNAPSTLRCMPDRPLPRIEVRTDSSLNSNLFIDDLTFQSTAALPVTDETGANMTRDPLNTTCLESGESDYGMLKP
jgi:hypothetical protein